MFHYSCQCGASAGLRLLPPPRCEGCESCGTQLVLPSEAAQAPAPHVWQQQVVTTDEGPKTLTRCAHCHRTRLEIEKKR